MFQPLSDGTRNLAEVRFMNLLDDKKAVAGIDIWMPLGTVLQAGVKIELESQLSIHAPIVHCGSNGCLARFGITTAQFAAFKKSNFAWVKIRDVNAPKKDIKLYMSLIDFSAAYAKLTPITVPKDT